MAETTAQLQQKLLALTHGKVDIMLNKDEFKSTYDILKEMSVVWNDMTDVERAAALELIGGKRQANILASLISNFQTAEDAAKSATDSTGSALAENEKVLDSIQGKIQILTNSLQNMWKNAVGSDGVKMFLDIANAIVNVIDKVGLLQSAVMGIVGIMAARNNSFGRFFQFNSKDIERAVSLGGLFGGKDGKFSFKGGLSAGLQAAFGQISLNKEGAGKFLDFKKMGAGIKEYASKVKEAASAKKGLSKVTALGTALSNSDSAAKLKEGVAIKSVGVASKVAAIGVEALNMALSMAVAFAIQAAITGLVKLAHAHKDAADAAKEQAQTSREEYEEAKANQQSVNDLITKYKELKAQKLQTAEVRGEIASVQQEIVSLVGEQASGLNLVNGNLDTQLGKLEAIAAKQAEITNDKAKESYADANIAVNKAMGDDSFLMFDGWAYAGARDKGAEKFLQNAGYKNVQAGGFFNRTTFVSDEWDKAGNQLKNAVEKQKYLKSMIDDMEASYDDYQNSDVYSGLVDQYNAYTELVNARQQAAKSLLESTTSDFYYNNKKLDKEAVHSTETLQEYRNKMVEEIANSGELKAAIKNGDISISDIYSYVDDFIASTDDFTAYYGAWKSSFQKVLTKDQKEFTKDLMTGGKENGKYIKSWFDDLSEEDKKLVYDIAVEYDDEVATWNLQNWKDQLESMQETIEFSVDIDLESETNSIEGLNTAIQESMSATGLSEASIKNLQGRYSELAAQGYDLSAMFEETTNGIHLNRKAVSELEQAYATQKQEEFAGSLDGLKNKYDELTEKINNCSDASEKSSLIAERAGIAQQISEVATLASQYEGLTSAYKAWQDAESAGSERDMYENILKGFDAVDDEISRGWIDDGSIEFLELLTGRTDLATASTKELKAAYNGLDKEINSAGYSVRDFFTVDKDGNSTNTGVYNFLETVEALESDKAFKNVKNIKDLVKRDKNGNIVSFDFGVVGGDEAIAEALGISEELVQIMLRAADDAGFVVNMDGTYKQLADLQSEAVSANDKLKELSKTNDKLKEAGGDTTFDFNTSNVKTIEGELAKAQKILDTFKDKDGNINLEAEGAEEAMTIVSALQAKLDSLTSEKYGIGLTVEDKQFQEPLAKLQEYGHNVMTLNQLEINPKANAEEIEKINKQLNETANYFANLDEETKVQIGFEADDGVEEVKKKIEAGEVKIPTTLDIQAKMGKSIEDLKKIALLNSGILTKDQEETIKAELIADVDVEAGEVNTDKVVKDTEKKTDEALNGSGSKHIKTARDNISKLREEYTTAQKAAEKTGTLNSVIGAKQKYNALKGAQTDLYNQQLSKVDGLIDGKREAIVKVAVDYENGKADLDKLLSEIDSIPDEDKELKVPIIAELTKAGAFDELLSDLDDGSKEVVIKALTEGEGDVDQLNEIIDGLPEETQPEVRALVDDALDNVEIVDGKLQEINKDLDIEVMAKIFGVNNVEDLQEKLDGLDDKTIEAIAKVFGMIDVEKLKEVINGLDDKTVQAIAKALGAGDVEGLKNIINGLDDKTVQAIAEAFGFDSVESLKSAVNGLDGKTVQAVAEALGLTSVEGLKSSINGMEGKTVQAIADVVGKSNVDGLKTAISNLKSKTVTVTATVKKVASDVWSKLGGGKGDGPKVDGTAHTKGTAWASGTALKQGDWRTKKDEVALTGELGQELVVTGNRWYTVGDNGAEFAKIPRGSIIFNHKQTEEIFENGYITSRGKIAKANGTAHAKGTAWAEGTALSSGSGGWGKVGGKTSSGKKKKTFSSSSSKKSSSSKQSRSKSKSSESSKSDFEEVFDWFELKIEEINEQLDLMGAKLENAVTLSSKNNILDSMIATNKNQLSTLEKGIKLYDNYANDLLYKIPSAYRAAAKDGKIAIEEFAGAADEKTLEAINNYREWAKKVADLKVQLQEVEKEIANLAKQKFDNVYETYDVKATIERKQNEKLESTIDYDEERGYITSEKYYKEMMKNTKQQAEYLKTARNEMQKTLDAQVKAGNIKKYSDAWYEMVEQMYEVDLAIDECTLDLEKFQNAINDIYWDNFEELIDRLEYVTGETENLIDLMGEIEKPVITPEGDKGWSADEVKWSDEGLAQLGLYAQQMEVAEYEAKKYEKAIADLYEQYQKGYYSQSEYLEKLNELKDGQYDAIDAYYDARDAIVDLNETRVDSIKDGIQKEIDAYEELIDKKQDELTAERDLYDFQKSVNEQQKDIADIQKQISALSGDNSASARAKRKRLEAELAEANKNLEDTYYERSISDKQTALDKELETFQDEKDKEIEKWEKYLEDVKTVIADTLAVVQNNAFNIYDTLMEKAKEYNLTLSDSLLNPWKDGMTAVDDYADNFGKAVSSTTDELKKLEDGWQNAIDAVDKSASSEISDQNKENAAYEAAEKYVPPPVVKPPTNTSNSNSNKTIKVGGKINASGAPIYDYAGDKSGERQYFRNDPIYVVLGEKNGYLKVRWHKLSKGVTGWFKKGDVRAYARGSKEIDKDQWALIDELGEELVIKSSNGRLAYMQKGDGVVPADLTSNLMDWGELNPQDVLDRNRPSIAASPEVHATEINLNIKYGDMLKIENFNGENPDEVAKIVAKQFEKHTAQLNQSLKKYVR